MEQAVQQRSGHRASRKAESMSLTPPAVSKETEFEHKWHSSHTGERWGVGRKGIESMWMPWEQWFLIFFQLAHSQTLIEGSRKAACREIANVCLVFHSCICHTPCLSHKHLTEPHWLMNHRLNATVLVMGRIVKKHNCKDKKEGRRYRISGRDWIVSLWFALAYQQYPHLKAHTRWFFFLHWLALVTISWVLPNVLITLSELESGIPAPLQVVYPIFNPYSVDWH